MIKDLAEFGWHGHVIDTSKISYVGVIEYIDARVREQTTEGGVVLDYQIYDHVDSYSQVRHSR